MKHFTALDFQQQATDEGFTYFNCIMANGLELQVTPLDWGWQVGVYDIDGRLIAKENQLDAMAEAEDSFARYWAGSVSASIDHHYAVGAVRVVRAGR